MAGNPISLGDKPGGITTVAAAMLFIAGLILHLTERHRHPHRHEPLVHEHPHGPDAHHGHAH